MMKNKYRGIDKRDPKKAQWVTGSYHQHLPYTPYPMGEDPEKIKNDTQHLIIQDGFSDWGLPRSMQIIEVYPESVGMATGLVLDNDMIFDGDVLHIVHSGLAIDGEFVVYWSEKDYSFRIANSVEKHEKTIDKFLSFIEDVEDIDTLKKVGNIWEINKNS